jgi:AraC-type DNA-binding domain-containing proteins
MKNFFLKKIEHIKISKILSQSFLFIVFIVIIITAALGSFLYDQFYKLSYTSIGKSMVERLSQNSTQLNLLKDQIYTIGLYLTSDNDVIKSALTAESDPVDKYLLVKKLGYFTNTNKLIHSIFVYSSESKEAISNLGGSSIWVYDKHLQAFLISLEDNAHPQFTPRVIESGILPTNEQEVFSIVFNVGSKNYKSHLSSNIIINVNAHNFLRSIFNDHISSNNLIFDNKGKLILDIKSGSFNEYKTEPYISTIINSKNTNGFFLTTINGEKILVTYLKSSTLDWTLVNLTSYNDSFLSLTIFKNIIVYSSMVLLLIGILYAIFVSYRLYNPFKYIIQQLTSADPTDKTYIFDEAKHIKDSFIKLNKDNKNLEKSLTSSLPLAKNTFMRQLLSGRPEISIDDLSNKLHDLQINYLEGQVCVLFFKIETCENAKSGLDTKQISDIFVIIQNEFYLANTNFLFIETEVNYCKIISQFAHNTSIFELAGKIQQRILKEHNYSTYVVIGSTVNSLLDISSSYNNCVELLPYLFIKEVGSVLANENFNLAARLTNCEITDLKEQLFAAIKTGNSIQTSTIIDEIFKYISNCTYDLIRLIINQLILEIMSFSNSILTGIDDSLTFNNIYKNINNISTLSETRLFFALTCEAIIKKIDEKNKNPKKYLINDVKAYLKENFSSPNINSELIADVFKLSPGYLGKLFSDAAGCSIVDYINDIRLSKAAELLKNGSLFVNQISKRCGFADRTYFATLFKKKYGLTPKAYREQNIEL